MHHYVVLREVIQKDYLVHMHSWCGPIYPKVSHVHCTWALTFYGKFNNANGCCVVIDDVWSYFISLSDNQSSWTEWLFWKMALSSTSAAEAAMSLRIDAFMRTAPLRLNSLLSCLLSLQKKYPVELLGACDLIKKESSLCTLRIILLDQKKIVG